MPARLTIVVVAGLAVGCLIFILVRTDGAEAATDNVSREESSSRSDTPIEEIERGPAEATASEHHDHEAHENQPNLTPWFEDRDLFESVMATFNRNFPTWVAFSTEDCQQKQYGNEALSRAIWKNGGTDPLLQVRVEDFAGLREDEKIQISYLLNQAGARGQDSARRNPRMASDNEGFPTAQRDSIVSDSLSWPPDKVIALYSDVPLLEEVASRIRAKRIELLRSVAPDLVQMDYIRRFSLKAGMEHGLDRTRFQWEDCVLLAPSITEYELNYEAMCQAFAQYCSSELRQ